VVVAVDVVVDQLIALIMPCLRTSAGLAAPRGSWVMRFKAATERREIAFAGTTSPAASAATQVTTTRVRDRRVAFWRELVGAAWLR
jgi:hypothetical protein